MNTSERKFKKELKRERKMEGRIKCHGTKLACIKVHPVNKAPAPRPVIVKPPFWARIMAWFKRLFHGKPNALVASVEQNKQNLDLVKGIMGLSRNERKQFGRMYGMKFPSSVDYEIKDGALKKKDPAPTQTMAL